METITQIINIIGLVYVGIPLIFLIIGLICYLAGKKISQEMFDKIVEFGKWYIVSVAIVFSAKIIETGFTERETGIKEMQVYDKYVETILKADNNLEQAENKLKNLIKTGIDNPKIFFRNSSYRTLSKIFTTKEEANNYLAFYKHKLRKDVFIVNLDTWCPNEIYNGRYYECK